MDIGVGIFFKTGHAGTSREFQSEKIARPLP
jgi:hypothetical protein